MKRAAALIAILLSVVATGCASAPTRATETAVIQRSNGTVVINCLLKSQTRPSSLILTCADAGDVLAHLHWVSWGSTAAFATGTEQINDCTPNCAAGKFISYPVLVNLWRPSRSAATPARSTSPGSPASTPATARPCTSATAPAPATPRPAPSTSGASPSRCFLGSSGSGGFTAPLFPRSDGVAWIPLGQETLGESGNMF